MMMSHQIDEYSAEFKTFLAKNFNEKFTNSSSSNHINLTDSNGFNLLMMAIDKQQSLSLIDELLRLPFDINDKSNDGRSAADIAWQNKNYEILLKLLEANSTFPSDFYSDELETDDDDASKKIKEFINISLKMHTAITNNNINEITEIIKRKPNLRYFYNLSNISAATTALNSKKHQIYVILTSNDCSIGPHEDFHELLEKLQYEPDTKRRKLAQISDIHSEYSKNILERHLMIHYANIVVAHDDRFVKQRIKHVKEAYKVLNEIPLTRNILQLTSMHKNFKIHFDFNRTSVEFMNPFSGDQFTRGVCEDFKFKKFHLFVAAKELLSEEKFAAIGTLAHELCHFAMTLVFHNDCKPYDVDANDNEMKFKEIVDKCQELVHEKIVKSVYDCYGEVLWPAELIVRVPHMIAAYHNDSNKLNELKVIFKELFDYYDDVVAPKIIETIKMLEKLFNNSVDIEYNDLTNAYKAKIHHSNVIFQENEMKFNEIIEDKNSEIFQLLKSKQIRGFLLESSSLIIGYAEEVNVEFYIERDFIDYDLCADKRNELGEEIEHYIIEFKNFENSIMFNAISDKINESKMILMSDLAGAGKTTTFKHLSIKLKEKFPNHWINYVDLKRHLKIYEKYERNFQRLNILLEILEIIDDEIDAKIFTHLFNSNRVILLYDGVDEISPKFKNFFIKLIESVKETNNHQWISTRPQHMQELRTKFNQKAYKLLPFTHEKEKEFARNVLKNINADNVDETEIFERLNSLSLEFDSPLMLQMFIEIYINDKSVLHFFNLYLLYDKMTEMKKEIIEEKGKVVGSDRDNRKSKLSIWQIHQIYGLKLLYPDGFQNPFDENSLVDINEFSLLKRWRKEQSKWTPEAISRYGFLIIDNWSTDDEFPDFVHRTFAEFFVAQFLIQELYELDEDEDEISDKEIDLRFKLFIHTPDDDNRKWSFIESFVNNNKISKLNEKFIEKFKSNEVEKFLSENIDNDIGKNLIKSLSVVERFLIEFKFTDDKTIFQKYFTFTSEDFSIQFFLNLLEIVEIYERLLGGEWINHTGYDLREKFSMPSYNEISIDLTQLATDDDDDEADESDEMYCKIFYKLLHFIEHAEIPHNDFYKFFHQMSDQIFYFSIRSLTVMEKLMKIVRKHFNECRDKFDDILNEKVFDTFNGFINTKFSLCDGYCRNAIKLCEELNHFLTFDRMILPDYLKFFNVGMMISQCNLKSSEINCSKYEIQEFFIQYSVPVISRISNSYDINCLKSFVHFVQKNFGNDKNQLRKLFNRRYEGKHTEHHGHTLVSFIFDKINSQKTYFDGNCEEIEDIFNSLMKEVEIPDDEIGKIKEKLISKE